MSGPGRHRVPPSLAARLAAAVLVLAAAAALALLLLDRGIPFARTATLLSRAMHDDYEKATFSFEHGMRDDLMHLYVHNDWDVQFGNGDDQFTVTMVTDDRSRITDLGYLFWPQTAYIALPVLPAHPQPTREPAAAAIPGHVYYVHTTDSDTDLYALFRVEDLVPGDRCVISWRLVDPDSPARFFPLPAYLAVLVLLAACLLMIWRAARGCLRARRGCCPRCGYPVRDSETCPECGCRHGVRPHGVRPR